MLEQHEDVSPRADPVYPLPAKPYTDPQVLAKSGVMPKTPTKKTTANAAVSQTYVHDANGDLVTEETRSRSGFEAPRAIRRIEAGFYVVKKGSGFLLDDAGAIRFFQTTAAAMRAADDQAMSWGWPTWAT
jgi:hypothetical protein